MSVVGSAVSLGEDIIIGGSLAISVGVSLLLVDTGGSVVVMDELVDIVAVLGDSVGEVPIQSYHTAFISVSR
jgi:hypothetical protein